MFCLKPLRIVNPRYKKQGRDHLQFLDKPDYFIQVPCGLCLSCLKRFQNDWRVRLLSEFFFMSTEEQRCSRFLSLSISPKYYTTALKHPEKLIKHFRDEYRRKFKKSVRYWCITEYGDTTDRFHFHMLVFNTSATRSDFDEIWKFGFVNNKPIIKERILYCISYITDGVGEDLFIPKERKPKVFCSPGLGKSYVDSVGRYPHVISDGDTLVVDSDGVVVNTIDNKRFNLQTIVFGGYNYTLPRYIQQKLFTEEELRTIKFDRLIYMTTPKPPYRIGKLGYDNIRGFVDALRKQSNVLHPLILNLYG